MASRTTSYYTKFTPSVSKRAKIVTVCLANRARSPTAEWLLHRNYKVKSCGTAQFDATKPCDQWLMKWADKVLVMEPYQKDNLEQRFPDAHGKVEVLDVPEVGKFSCQPSLIREIADRLLEHGFRVRNIKDIANASNECMYWTSEMAGRKMKSKQARSYALTDYWTPFGENDVEVGAPERSKPLAPWQIEERLAFMRASALPHGQGGISWAEEDLGGELPLKPEDFEPENENAPRVTEDTGGMRVWVGDKELNDEEIDALTSNAALEGDTAPYDVAEIPEGFVLTPKGKKELKEYAKSVKKFFQT